MAAGGFAAVLLAAGHGKRMKSRLPKVLHEAAGRPLLEHVLRAVRPLAPDHTVVVVGHGAGEVRARFADDDVVFAHQGEQLGTGHALRTALDSLPDYRGHWLVLTGDAPLLTSESLRRLRDAHLSSNAGMSLLTYRVADPTGLGRIVRDGDGRLVGIVEEKDASDEERLIDEVSPGLLMFDGRVREYAGRLRNDNAQGEYYITDLPAFYLADGAVVTTVEGRDETGLLVGVNDRLQLAQAERLLRERVRRRWLAEGVTMLSPETTFVDDTVELGRDVVLEQFVVLRGSTRVGEGARVGAFSLLEDVTVPAGSCLAPYTRERG